MVTKKIKKANLTHFKIIFVTLSAEFFLATGLTQKGLGVELVLMLDIANAGLMPILLFYHII
jgi:hypothetical protein